MPIRLENRARYPADWRQISAAVRAEAGNRCEWCWAPNGVLIRRGTFQGRPVWSEAASAHCDVFCADTGERLTGESHDTCDLRPPVRVVLTVAHLDHQPEITQSNLAALCKRHGWLTGRTGRFPPGIAPANKGQKGRCAPAWKPSRSMARAVCRAINGACTCDLNGSACFAWAELLRAVSGDVDMAIAVERKRIEYNRAHGTNHPAIMFVPLGMRG